MRKDCMTCSAVSVSVASRVMKSRKASNVTKPVWLASTTDMMRWKSASPYNTHTSVIGVHWGRKLLTKQL